MSTYPCLSTILRAQVEECVPLSASLRKDLPRSCSRVHCSKRVFAAAVSDVAQAVAKAFCRKQGLVCAPPFELSSNSCGRWIDKALDGLSALFAARLRLRRGWTEHRNIIPLIPRSFPGLASESVSTGGPFVMAGAPLEQDTKRNTCPLQECELAK